MRNRLLLCWSIHAFSPLLLRDTATQEIYALDAELP
jgi:hypothetical protein